MDSPGPDVGLIPTVGAAPHVLMLPITGGRGEGWPPPLRIWRNQSEHTSSADNED
jgi:hypothetical protein